MTPTEYDGDDLEERYANAPELRARTRTQDDGTTVCTIFPAAASGDDRTSRCISAEEGSYVELPQMR
jgi:hypothetical protein